MRLLLAVVLVSTGLALAPTSVPLYPLYRWPGLAGLSVTAPTPRFGFEALCNSPVVANDARAYAVAARAVVLQPAGQWNLSVQVIHWRGDTATGGETAMSALDTAGARLRDCQATAAGTSPSITTNDTGRLAAVISDAGRQVMHEYLLADPDSSTVVELAMWSALPPQVDWPPVADTQVLDAMAAPLCNAYIGSCR